MPTLTNAATIATPSDLEQCLQPVNGSVTIGQNTIPNSLVGEILTAFNAGSALQLAGAVPNLTQNGVTVQGTTPFLRAQRVTLSATFMINGDFTLTATLPDLRLSTLLAADSQRHVPNNFDVDLGTVVVVIRQAGNVLTLTAGASSPTIGEFALKAQQVLGKWGIAAGFEVKTAGIASLPGMKGSPLTSFDSFIGLQNLLMVMSSFDDPHFTFPDAGSFNAPTVVGAGSIQLPGSGGLKAGFNLYANLSGTNSGKTNRGFQLLANYLKLRPEGMLIALSVSTPDPLASSQLFLEVDNINVGHGVTMSGQFGGEIESSVVGVYFSGTALAPIQHQSVTFMAQALAVPTGVVVGGSMQAQAAPLTFDIGSTKLGISELALVIGIDDEGVPSLGFATTFDINQINVSAAIFVDSAVPTQSVFAAALSGFSLLDVATCIANQPASLLRGSVSAPTAIPYAFTTVLSQFRLTATETFALPATLATALNTGDLNAIATAFANSPKKITLPTTFSQVLLDVNTKGSLWYITDLTTRLHYMLKLSGGSIQASLEPQFYFAPQDSSIGGLDFPQGFYVDGQLNLLLLNAKIHIDVRPSTGIVAEVDVDPVTILNTNFFALNGAGSTGGPHVSIASMSQSGIANPLLSQPHILISGEVKLLGIDVSSTYFVVSPSGVTFNITNQATPWLSINLNGSFSNSASMALGGAITVGIDDTFALGNLGTIPVVCDANGTLSLSLLNNVASAHVQLAFTFATWSISFGADLDVNVGSFASQAALMQLIHTAIFNALNTKLLGDIQGWITWFYNLCRSGGTLAAGMQQIGTALENSYNLVAKDGTTAMNKAGVAVDDIGAALRNGYNLASADTAKAMNGAGMAASDIAGALKSAYSSSDTDAATAMKTAGIAVGDVASGLKSAYSLSALQVAVILDKTLGYGVDDVYDALKHAGFSTGDIISAIWDEFKKVVK